VAQNLSRTTFEVSLASEYFDARQLSTLTGVAQEVFASVCLKELLDNSLDACETAGVVPKVAVLAKHQGAHLQLFVEDNGPGLAPELVRKVIDYDIRVSDKAAYRSPTRGAQGNALKTIIGIPYALGVRGQSVAVWSRGLHHQISPSVDPAGMVRINHVLEESDITEGTLVGVALPVKGQSFDPLHWVRSVAAFNPHATISYQGVNPGIRK
jgi:DNA topoisomerase VI subunit B